MTEKSQIVLVVLGVAALVWYAKKGFAWIGKTALPAVGNAVNPISDKNLAYRATSAVVGVFDEGASVGTAVADAFPSNAERRVNEMLRKPPASTRKTVPTNKSVVTPAQIAIDPFGNPRPVAEISRNPYGAPGSDSGYTGVEQNMIVF